LLNKKRSKDFPFTSALLDYAGVIPATRVLAV
jgi:hypothetical protein